MADWLAQVGVIVRLDDQKLQLTLPSADLQGMRRGKGSTADRLVLDLDGPALVQRVGDDLHLGLRSTAAQQRELRRLRLIPQQGPDSLVLKGQATRLRTLSLATPWRVVLDGIRTGGPATTAAQLPLGNPAIARWLRRGLVLEERTVTVGVKPLRVLRTGGDLSRIGLTMTPLTMAGQQQGLRFLPQLSQPANAVIAINGGFFNRILQLPLGALRQQGQWLSGPILNRGVVAWGDNDQLQFGRCLLYTSPSPRDGLLARMPSSA